MSEIEKIVRVLQKSSRVLVVTGAGMSVDSGIPTYRGIGGIYNNDKLMEGKTIEEIMSGETIRRDPQLVWKCLKESSAFFMETSPNRGHEIIAEMDQYFTVCVYTQNVDGFHSLAGSKNVINLHGSMRNLKCMNCDYEHHINQVTQIVFPPHCPRCEKIMRPDVVFFGELLCHRKMRAFEEEMAKGFDIVFVIGTSMRFPYIISPVYDLYKRGVFVVEINPEETGISEFTNVHLQEGASKSLEEIWQKYLKCV